jgi:GNAT superfamily N-acetyltransferase
VEKPPEGKLDFDQTRDRVLGGHCMGITPPLFMTPCPKDWLDDDFFVGRNSWGDEWGNRGFFAMRPPFFDREVYEAWATDQSTEFPKLHGTGIQHVQWRPGHDLDSWHLVYDIVDIDTDNRLAWAIVVLRRGEMHVDDFYVKPEARRRGYGTTMFRAFADESQRLRLPLRFWNSFADAENRESIERIRAFFSKQGLGFERSAFASAAFCAVAHGAIDIPEFELPPKASFLFASSNESKVDWPSIGKAFQVSDEFLEHTKSVFERHGETLRRLA